MISIIISSANAEQLKQVTENIAATIGTPFEIIAIDNSKGQQGICAVYNQGIKRAQYDILCFMHEDIIIITENWGAILKSIFDGHTDIGLLGVAGGGYKPFSPSGWAGIGIQNTFSNIIQTFKYADRETAIDVQNPNNARIEQVACIDGVWMATTSKVAAEFKLDENLFKGFHVYDIDYSITIGQKYKVAVTYEILLNHLSEGNYTRDWMEDTINLHGKWKDHLPINIIGFDEQQIKFVEKHTFKYFLKQLINFSVPMGTAFGILRGNKKYREWGLLWKLQYYTVIAYIKGKQP